MPGGISPPLEVMMTWPKPNYKNPETRPKTVLITACVFGPLTTLLIFVRLWIRLRVQRNAGWDDWLMLAALFPIIGLTVILPLSTELYGFDRHVWDVDPRLFPTSRKYVLAIEVVFCVATGLIKISILLFYRRLSVRAISRGFRWATWITIGFIASYSIAFAIVPIFLCDPISAFWDQTDIVKIAMGYEFKCLNEGADVFAAGVISAVQDLITAILPTFLYWNLQIPFRQKVALFGIFAIGYGVVALGALRAYASYNIFFKTYDVTWASHENWLFTMLELHIGALCANAPTLKVFFKQFLNLERLTNRSKSRSNRSKEKNGSNTNTSSTKSTPSLWEKFGHWKHGRSHSKGGYLSEPHTDVSVDLHGGVQKNVEVDIEFHSKLSRESLPMTANSVDILTGQYSTWDHDIEMGSFESMVIAEEEELSALPPMPSQPQSAPAAATTSTIATTKTSRHTKNNSRGLFPFPQVKG